MSGWWARVRRWCSWQRMSLAESRVAPAEMPVVDRPETANATVGGALVGLAAGVAAGFALEASDAALAAWCIGGTTAGAFLTRLLLDLADRVFGIDLAGPMGGGVRGAKVALQLAVPASMFATAAGAGWVWLWLPPSAMVVGAIIGGVWERGRSEPRGARPRARPERFPARAPLPPLPPLADDLASGRRTAEERTAAEGPIRFDFRGPGRDDTEDGPPRQRLVE